MILEAQNCPSAGSFELLVTLDAIWSARLPRIDDGVRIRDQLREVMTYSHIPIEFAAHRRSPRSVATSSQTGCPAGELVQYLHPASPCLFTKRARRAGRPSNFGANRMHRASRLCSSRIVVSAAQSPKVERLLRALRLKAFPVQSRPVEHSAPPCSSDFVNRNEGFEVQVSCVILPCT